MNILITGGTGFIGSRLCVILHQLNHTLTVLTRNINNAQSILPENTKCISSLLDLPESANIDIIINLAGEGIADKRWTSERKRQLELSRIDLTANIIAFIRQRKNKPTLLISGSAIGYFGDSGNRKLTEYTEPHEEFSHRLCAAWESQALRAKSMDVRVCVLRTGLVIGKNGGFLKKMLPSFRLGLGARLADGKQWMSWIHLDDYINIILLLMSNEQTQGIFNATAPNPATNLEFTKTLAAVLHRPSFLVLPKSILNLMFGEMSQLLITGQRVIPKKLLDNDFDFKYPDLPQALKDVC